VSAGLDIEAALSAVSSALEAGDYAAASASVETLVACCRAAEGTRLPPDQVDRLSRLLERCNGMAAAAQGQLTESLLQFGNGGRAQRAYGDR
jgi:hypothetical protein